jgi:stage V sporulation protein K
LKPLEKLGQLPGMVEVKKQVEQIIHFNRISKMRASQGLKTESQSLHLIFTGNPGTGKTTAARLIGEAFASLGILKTNPERNDNSFNNQHNNQKQRQKQNRIPFVEIHHADVASKFVGDAEKTILEKFRQARGGVLFIDEAYAFIAGDTEHKTGEKVIAAIVQQMEDMREEVMVIAAGYAREMDDFLDSNPGLRSRFSNTVAFPDYSVPDMVVIAQKMLGDRDYIADNDYLRELANRLWVEKDKKGFGNARTVRNIVEQSIRMQSARVAYMDNPSRQDLMVLTVLDIEKSNEKALSEKEILLKSLSEIQGRLLEIDLMELLSKSG